MEKVLTSFLADLHIFTTQEISELSNALNVEEVKKNTIIVKQGQSCSQCYFVLKGLLRQYIMADGLDKTIALYAEQEAVNYFIPDTGRMIAESNLCTIEDTVMIIGNPGEEQEMYSKFPKLEKLTRQMIEADYGKTQKAFNKFMTSSPEERYMNMMEEKPELLSRVPQYQLASYLGVTPESLSRIRKRIMEGKNK